MNKAYLLMEIKSINDGIEYLKDKLKKKKALLKNIKAEEDGNIAIGDTVKLWDKVGSNKGRIGKIIELPSEREDGKIKVEFDLFKGTYNLNEMNFIKNKELIPGDSVKIIDKNVITYFKIGKIITSANADNKFEIDFGKGWVGFYTKEQLLKIKEI